MATNHANPDTSANPSKDSPTCPERDARKGTHHDGSTDTDKESPTPPHGHVSHGKSRFLRWVGERRAKVDGFDPDISDLSELYDKWRDSDKQAELGRWSE